MCSMLITPWKETPFGALLLILLASFLHSLAFSPLFAHTKHILLLQCVSNSGKVEMLLFSVPVTKPGPTSYDQTSHEALFSRGVTFMHQTQGICPTVVVKLHMQNVALGGG